MTCGVMRDRRPVPLEGSRQRRREAGHYAQKARFSAAVGAGQQHRIARLQRKGKSAEDETATASAAEVSGDQKGRRPLRMLELGQGHARREGSHARGARRLVRRPAQEAVAVAIVRLMSSLFARGTARRATRQSLRLSARGQWRPCGSSRRIRISFLDGGGRAPPASGKIPPTGIVTGNDGKLAQRLYPSSSCAYHQFSRAATQRLAWIYLCFTSSYGAIRRRRSR
jgi:hypothetical protein